MLKSVPSLSTRLASNEVLATLSSSLQQYQKDEAVILGVFSVLVTILSLETHSILSVEIQSLLERVSVVMETFMDNLQIQQYSLSFLTLALVEVAPQVDESIIKILVKLVLVTMTTHETRPDIIVWGCKAISQMAPHKLILDKAIAENMTDHLLAALSLHPTSSGVQTWGSYALYQLTCYNNSLLPLVKDSDCLEHREASLPHLNEEARTYVEQLAKLATL